MEKKEVKNKVCYLCGKFRGYYTKELSHFERTKLGYCYKQQKVVKNLDCCENWSNGINRFYSSRKTSMKVLSELLSTINGIKQILKESNEGENE